MTWSLKRFHCIPIRENYAPEFVITGDSAEIKSLSEHGYFAGRLEGLLSVKYEIGQRYSISIPYQKTGNKTTAAAILTFFNMEEKKISSNYFQDNGDCLELSVEIPEGSVMAKLNLMFSSKGQGAVIFRNPKLEITVPKAHRIVKVASAFIECKCTKEENLQRVLDLIEAAGNASDKPDVICFTECVYDLRCPERVYIHENSPEIQAVCEKAKENQIYVLFTAHEKDDADYYYNTAFLISDEGKICGKYRKAHLTWAEFMEGMITGDELPVFDTPFGKIGILICWDQWFAEASRVLTSKGAEIIFWLTKGFHEERVITRARDNGVYYVVCHPRPENCCVVHPTTGARIVRGKNNETQGFISAAIDLDDRPISEYKSLGKNGGNDKEVFLNERRTDLYS